MKAVHLFLSLLCLSSVLIAEEAKAPATTVISLKPRLPQWRPQIVQSYPNGNPERVLFFETTDKNEKIAVKQQRFYNDGTLKNEMDLIAVEENSPGYEEWKSKLVPHGVSVSFF